MNLPLIHNLNNFTSFRGQHSETIIDALHLLVGQCTII